MKNNKKRGLAILLAVMMVAVFMPSMTFAAAKTTDSGKAATTKTVGNCKVTFNSTYFDADTVLAGESYTLPTSSPKREGYHVTEWTVTKVNGSTSTPWPPILNSGGDPIAPGDVLTGTFTQNYNDLESLTLTPTWEKNKYTVKYKLNNGDADVTETVAYNSNPTKTPIPTRDGYTFAGWYTNAALTKPADPMTTADVKSEPIKEDTIYYADWDVAKDTVIIKFDTTAGNNASSGYDSAKGSLTTTFLGKATVVNEATYLSTGAGADVGTKIDLSSITVKANPGYTFKGWYENKKGNGTPITTLDVTEKTTLYAVFDEVDDSVIYKVTYDFAGGEKATSGNYPAEATTDGKISKIDDPVKTGYVFTGWTVSPDKNATLDGAHTNKLTSYKDVKGDVKLTATWAVDGSYVGQYKVTYENINGTCLTSTAPAEDVTQGAPAKLADPTNVKSKNSNIYTFEGWYMDAAYTNKVTAPFIPTADTTLYAKWNVTKAKTYTVTYANTNGTCLTSTAPAEKVVQGSAAKMAAPTNVKSKNTHTYTFNAWYMDSAFKTKAPASFVPTADTTLYAKWNVK